MTIKILASIIGICSLFLTTSSLVFAQANDPKDAKTANQVIPSESSILTDGKTMDCVRFMKLSKVKPAKPEAFDDTTPMLREAVIKDLDIIVKDIVFDKNSVRLKGEHTVPAREMALTCGIKSGRIPLWLIPFYIVRVIDFLLLAGALISVLFIVIGGYHMIIGGFAEEKEKGKNTIKYALFGLVLTLLAYTIVNLALLFLSS